MSRTLATAIAALLGTAAHAAEPVSRGAYLARIMDCGGCHTPGAMAGKPNEAMHLAGADVGFGVPGLGVFYPPNLTSPNAIAGARRSM